MNIVLTGLRGSGKTKLGKIISKKLSWNFVDTDDEIEKLEKKSIKDIVKLKGWEYFRSKESEFAKKIAELDKTVIATGGGMIIDKDNEKELKKNGKIVYLYIKPDICIKRIINSDNRPKLTDLENITEEVNQIYIERNFRYCKSSNHIFERSEDLKKDADELIKLLNVT